MALATGSLLAGRYEIVSAIATGGINCPGASSVGRVCTT